MKTHLAPNNKRNPSGFTLVQALACLVIIGAAFTIGPVVNTGNNTAVNKGNHPATNIIPIPAAPIAQLDHGAVWDQMTPLAVTAAPAPNIPIANGIANPGKANGDVVLNGNAKMANPATQNGVNQAPLANNAKPANVNVDTLAPNDAINTGATTTAPPADHGKVS